MNKLTRTLTMGGFGILAALAVGAAPAQATTGNAVPEKKSASHKVQLREGVQVVGYYRTPQACELAGRFGERDGYWDIHDCSPVRLGLRRGAWALQVASDDDWDRVGFAVPLRAVVGFPVRFRPIWPGQYGPGRPGGFGHGHGPRGHDGPRGHGHDGPRGHGHDGPGRR
ncbi:hypothetical protein Apa02nite_031400 [Actinoplanes palleronii]|uniref:Uncharacterized protein n=1 Tax=Actinoplanes palleronii TaxID=113570 RepID=A0ABQ4B8V6_9ACTN|nr:hypothetical protein Apa02nite_031400 [Actinoplanes palleronii]